MRIRSLGSSSLLLFATLAFCSLSRSAWAFAFIDFSTNPSQAPRWSAADHPEVSNKGLSGGIDVSIETNFAETLTTAVTGMALPADVALVEAAIDASFRVWENSELTFNVTFDGPVLRGETVGAELDLFIVPETDPVFSGNPYFGVTYLNWVFLVNRQMTNGDIGPGNVISGSDIFLNIDMITAVAPALNREQQLAALQRLLSHEIGHALGLHHPHDGPSSNFDTDGDPLNAMIIDPLAPFTDLILSPNISNDIIMSRMPAGLNTLLYTSLTRDDRGGRDALYPVPGDAAEICSPMPTASCRTSLKSKLQIRKDPSGTKSKLQWKWLKGAATDVSDWSDPTVDTRYSVCIYASAVPKRLGEIALPDASKWSALSTKGYRYEDSAGSPRGATKIILKAGEQDKASMLVKGAGPNLPTSLLPETREPVVIQLQRADTSTCWQSQFTAADAVLDDAEQYKAKIKP